MGGGDGGAFVTLAASQAVDPYSQGVLMGDLLFVSGQLPVDPMTAQLPAGVADWARQTLSNVVAVVEVEAIAA